MAQEDGNGEEAECTDAGEAEAAPGTPDESGRKRCRKPEQGEEPGAVILRREFQKRHIVISNDIVQEPPKDKTGHEEHICYDLTVGTKSQPPWASEMKPFGKAIKIRPGRCISVETAEKVIVPDGYLGVLCNETRLTKRGLLVPSTKIDPVYDHHLEVTVFNAGSRTQKLYPNDEFCSIYFVKVIGKTKAKMRHRPLSNLDLQAPATWGEWVRFPSFSDLASLFWKGGFGMLGGVAGVFLTAVAARYGMLNKALDLLPPPASSSPAAHAAPPPFVNEAVIRD